jgi:hypothetical protein
VAVEKDRGDLAGPYRGLWGSGQWRGKADGEEETGDAEKSEGGEQRVRCREAEAGVHFIGPRRWWGGGEKAGGGGVLLLVDFEGVKGGRGDETALIWWGK